MCRGSLTLQQSLYSVLCIISFFREATLLLWPLPFFLMSVWKAISRLLEMTDTAYGGWLKTLTYHIFTLKSSQSNCISIQYKYIKNSSRIKQLFFQRHVIITSQAQAMAWLILSQAGETISEGLDTVDFEVSQNFIGFARRHTMFGGTEWMGQVHSNIKFQFKINNRYEVSWTDNCDKKYDRVKNCQQLSICLEVYTFGI